MTTESHEVTRLLFRCEQGDEEAFKQLWERAFPVLVAYARRRVGAGHSEEDYALSAMKSLWVGFQQGRFNQLGSRDDLWRLLFKITSRKITARRREQMARKRGGGMVRGESALGRSADRELGTDLDLVAGDNATPAEEVEMLDSFNRLLGALPDETLRQVALWRLEGYTQAEIADRLDCATRTVKRKLALIRQLWSREIDHARKPERTD
jgi:RNA polymerase sigma factor (sigma-70 family)